MSKRNPQSPPPKTIEVVDPRWLLKAGALVILGAFLCAYGALCLLFWQGQWQLVLTPSTALAATPAARNLTFESVHFGVDPTGAPQLTGWWIPSDSPTDPTVLVLHGNSGNMSDALPAAHSLHAARLNVLLFDYRGFGASNGPHPNEVRMERDADNALDYLTQTRHIPLSQIVLYGDHAGASLATRLAVAHREIPALILYLPDGDLESRAASDPRARLAPVALLFHERFPLAGPLLTLTTPKLIFTSSTEDASRRLNLHDIANPKMSVELRTPTDFAAEPLSSVVRFLDSYLPRGPQQLQPLPSH